jgi:hypothetical protein
VRVNKLLCKEKYFLIAPTKYGENDDREISGELLSFQFYLVMEKVQ